LISTIITGDDSWVYGYGQDEAANISVKDTKFTVIEDSTISLKQCQINVDSFFFDNDAVKTNSIALVRKRTILTKRPPLVGEVSANFSRSR
jgi:hypothetical protein